jgi:acetyl esterase
MKFNLSSRLRIGSTRTAAALALWARPLRGLLLQKHRGKINDGLDADLAVLWSLNDLSGQGHFWKQGATLARERMRQSMAIVNAPRREFAHVVATPLSIDGANGKLQARHYAAPATAGQCATIVFFHGGGWVVGDLDTHDELCRNFAAHVGIRVIAVDYRRAPEHRFPGGVEDAVAAFRYVRDHAKQLNVDAHRIAVCGDSAGGNFSASVCIASRDDAIAPCLQVLLYPGLDATRTEPSHQQHAQGLGLDRASIDWYLSEYLGSSIASASTLHDCRLSPGLASDEQLRGVAPAIIEIAGFDPLRDEAVAFAQRLRGQGVAVEQRLHRDMVHGYCLMTGLCQRARQLTDEMTMNVAHRLLR